MKLSGAEITIKLLERRGIKDIIGIPGGANLPIYDALYKSNINHILARHEQGAAFMAQGISRVTGKAAVCFATSGPGATNLITAIADAKLDSVPMVAITGQVPYGLIGTDAFQEVDTYGLTIPITKHNFLIRSIEELFKIIPQAFKIAESGRPGPVLVDIPKDIQNQIYEFENWPEDQRSIIIDYNMPKDSIDKIADMINKAERPIVYMGGGVILGDASQEINTFAKKGTIPVTTTLMGLGAFPCDDDLYLGMLGMHGARYTNLILHEADLLLAFGVRFDDRAVGNITKFCPDAKIVHVDIDAAEIDKIRKVDISITGHIKDILTELIPKLDSGNRESWLNRVRELKRKHPFVLPKEEDFFHPVNIIKYVASLLPEDAIIATDVGQHQMWTAQIYPFKKPRTFLTSGGLGTMGFGLPAALGAALANKDVPVVCFTGDGSLLMNIQELATLADLGLNVKVIVLNNGHLGLVRQQQEMFYEEHYIASKFITNVDYAAISNGFGVKGCDLKDVKDPANTLKEIFSSKEPWLINVPIKENENVVPIVPPGAGNTEMIGGEISNE